ncbi:MAG: hypothetical protein RIR70_206 [Pseudomonadota bacterium]
MLTPDGYFEKLSLTRENLRTIKPCYRSLAYRCKPPNFFPKAPIGFLFAESNPHPQSGSDRGIGKPPNRQGAALFNQGIDSLNHGIASKTVPGVRLELTRRGG